MGNDLQPYLGNSILSNVNPYSNMDYPIRYRSLIISANCMCKRCWSKKVKEYQKYENALFDPKTGEITELTDE
jgi:hypothetical protein